MALLIVEQSNDEDIDERLKQTGSASVCLHQSDDQRSLNVAQKLEDDKHDEPSNNNNTPHNTTLSAPSSTKERRHSTGTTDSTIPDSYPRRSSVGSNELQKPSHHHHLHHVHTLNPISEDTPGEWPNSIPRIHTSNTRTAENNNNGTTEEEEHVDLTRQFSSHTSNGIRRLSTSFQSTANTAIRSRHTSDHEDREAVFRLPSTLSLPPGYKLYSTTDTGEQQLRQDIAHLNRMDAFYRSNPGAMMYEFFWGDPAEDGKKKVSFSDACHTCFLMQYTGFFMVFWTFLLAFIGCLSFFVMELPSPMLLLWLPVICFLTGVYVAHKKKKQHLIELEELEQHVEEARMRRVDEIVERRNRLNDHYFVIKDHEDHSHAVVTLIPPPPAYMPMEKMESTSMVPTNHSVVIQIGS